MADKELPFAFFSRLVDERMLTVDSDGDVCANMLACEELERLMTQAKLEGKREILTELDAITEDLRTRYGPSFLSTSVAIDTLRAKYSEPEEGGASG